MAKGTMSGTSCGDGIETIANVQVSMTRLEFVLWKVIPLGYAHTSYNVIDVLRPADGANIDTAMHGASFFTMTRALEDGGAHAGGWGAPTRFFGGTPAMA